MLKSLKNMRPIYIINLLLIFFIMASCNKKDKNLPAPTHTYYIDTKIDGTSVAYEDSIYGVLNSASLTSTDFGAYKLTRSGSSFSGTNLLNQVVNTTISQYKKGCDCDTAFIDSLFTVNSYSFKNNAEVEGIEITWFDGTQTWSTSAGTADQSGSSFKIVKHEFVNKNEYRYISSGNLNCKLYNGNGDSKIMTGYFKIKTNRIN
jgi:hypothetical protein